MLVAGARMVLAAGVVSPVVGDILLPEATDLESTQLIKLGKTKFVEQYWQHQGWVLRQPAVPPQGDTRDFSWIATEIARRTGLLGEYVTSINRGAMGVALACATIHAPRMGREPSAEATRPRTTPVPSSVAVTPTRSPSSGRASTAAWRTAASVLDTAHSLSL